MARKKSHSMTDLVGEVFKKGGMKRSIRKAEVVVLWPQVVGADLAKFTTARSFKDGTLFVEVPDSETGTHLTIQRQRFLDVYKVKFGIKDLKDIRFRVGSKSREHESKQQATKDAAYKPKKHSIPVDAVALANLSKDVTDLPEPLVQPTMRLARSLLERRAQRQADGWQICEVCDTPTDTVSEHQRPMCNVCLHHSKTLKVERVATNLSVQPDVDTSHITEDERRVAIYLAKMILTHHMQVLLPQTLSDPTFKDYLEFAAKCYLAHDMDKPIQEVTEEHYSKLEPKVARVLGYW